MSAVSNRDRRGRTSCTSHDSTDFFLERVWAYLGVTMVLVAAIGTWLIWFSALLRQNLQEERI